LLARANGLDSITLEGTLHRRWPGGEKMIAEALGCKPSDLRPLRRRGDARKRAQRFMPM